MKKRLLTLIGLMVLAVSARAGFDGPPDTTIQVSFLKDIAVVGDYAVGITSEGVSCFAIDGASESREVVNISLMDLSNPVMKVCGDILIVADDSHWLHYFDLSVLPQIEPLGSVEIGVPFVDFVVNFSAD